MEDHLPRLHHRPRHALPGSWFARGLRIVRPLVLALAAAVPAASLAQDASEDPLPPLPPPDPPQEPPKTWVAWEGVEKIRGISQVDHDYRLNRTTDTTRRKDSLEDHASVFMELEQVYQVSSDWTISWRVISAFAEGGTLSTYSFYGLGAGRWLGNEGVGQGTYTGPMSLRTDPDFWFDLRTGKGQFGTLIEVVTPFRYEINGTNTRLGPEPGQVVIEEVQTVGERSTLRSSNINLTVPKAAVPFTGRFDYSWVSEDHGTSRDHATVQFWPEWEDVDLEVKIEVVSQPGTTFLDWRPEGSSISPEAPGPHPLKITATLKPKTPPAPGAPPKPMPEVRRFRFELAKTSREPGVCMNWPMPAGASAPDQDPEFDLRFAAPVPDVMVLSPRKQKVGVRPIPGDDPRLPSAWALLECFDFGAFAELQVYAELADERVIVGHLDVGAEQRYLVRIPDRAARRWIARKWLEDHKAEGQDTADDDDQPTGDGQKGDGFSLYEEYRGFRVGATNISTDPSVKDLFIRNENGGPVSAACRFLELHTAEKGRQGLKIWEKLTAQEWHPSRVMNLNRSSLSPKSTDEPQHGIRAEPNTGETNVVISYADFEQGQPHRPKGVKSIRIHPRANQVKIIAHEIAHCLGVRHHGDLDYYATWDVEGGPALDGTTRLHFIEQPLDYDVGGRTFTELGRPYPVRVFQTRGGEEILPDVETILEYPKLMFIARRTGQHAGEDLCCMRYNVASAYVPTDGPLDRIKTRPSIAIGLGGVSPYTLCTKCQGTGINPRIFGHADRGNCLGQLCVRDSAPERTPPTGQCPKD